jgi:hypothetical protein
MLPFFFVFGACVSDGSGGAVRRAGAGDAHPGDTGAGDSDTGADGDTADGDTGDTGMDGGPCPAEMALAGTTCVDRWEDHLSGASPYDVPTDGVAVSEVGAVPQGYISGEVAAAACAAAGKRLCSLGEWMRACGGPDGTTWPYGDTYDPGACNDTRPTHPVVDYFPDDPDRWDSAHMNDPGLNQQPDTVDPAGANPGCVSPEGIYDLHGNLHEWIDDPAGTFKGGFYADASLNGPGCTYTTSAHTFDYHDYSTGFRCCRDPSAR